MHFFCSFRIAVKLPKGYKRCWDHRWASVWLTKLSKRESQWGMCA